jgi:hypothetical protein
MNKVQLCGCGKHYIRDGDTVQWEGKQWSAKCAFKQASEALQLLRESSQKCNRIKIVVEGINCSLCKRPVGRAYTLHGNNVYHRGCLIDIGGES